VDFRVTAGSRESQWEGNGCKGENITVLGTASIVISVAGWTTGHDILIVDNLDSNSLILGTDFMKKHHIIIAFASQRVCIDNKVEIEYIYATETKVPQYGLLLLLDKVPQLQSIQQFHILFFCAQKSKSEIPQY